MLELAEQTGLSRLIGEQVELPSTRVASGAVIGVGRRAVIASTRARPTRKHLASSAQLGPPSSVEPTVRPGLARLVAVKRARDAAEPLPNTPETGCASRDH
ncbi:hypothetical protein MLAC_05090 [Mycobacterium lacus]|uniref:Uncharacterized protein n=1 Tax=Mycobacterium lacus TaxID=169765 RepID=A0A7I7NF43_9MYCO|nr:hypothetical protein MLAC_05090 [Mycobacterium lacus]